MIIATAKKYLKEIKTDSLYGPVHKKYSEFSMVTRRDYIDCLKLVSKFKDVNGSVIECGVWRGGMIAGIAEVLGNNRNYYLFDSFEGLPDAKEALPGRPIRNRPFIMIIARPKWSGRKKQ